MPRKIKMSKEEYLVEDYMNGEVDLRKLGKKYEKSTIEVQSILQENGLL